MRLRLFCLLTFVLVMAIADDRWLTMEQVGDRQQIPISTLRDWRARGYGPRSTKLGRGRNGAVRYRLSDVEAWEAEREQADRQSAGVA
jgi:hypothetical protein